MSLFFYSSFCFQTQATEELKEALNPEFAYMAYVPFANFFGETVMEQTLRNYDFIKDLCAEYISSREAAGHQIPGKVFYSFLFCYLMYIGRSCFTQQ
jgi:hypothetical protein